MQTTAAPTSDAPQPSIATRAPAQRTARAVALALLLAAFCWLALDGHHYWHEARFVFATTEFSLADLLSGRFNPHQAGGPIDELEAGGFYASKALHLGWLAGVLAIAGPARGWTVAVAVSLLAVLAALALSVSTLRRLDPGGPSAGALAVSVLLLPAAAYLAGKLLSEVTALLCVALALRALVGAVAARGRRALSRSAVAAAALVATALARLDMVLCFAAFVCAGAAAGPPGCDRRRLVRVGAAVALGAGAAYLVSMPLVGIRPAALWRYLDVYLGLEPKSWLMSAVGPASFGGLHFLAGVVALARRRRGAAFHALWAALAAAPMIAITSNYMVEPRYLAPALLPLGALAACALPRALPRSGRRRAAWVLAAAGAVAVQALLIGSMPFELDAPALGAALDRLESWSPGAAVLLPWAYTDFHWLHVVRPRSEVYTVYTPGGVSGAVDPAWRRRFERWYGEAYLGSPAELDARIAPGRAVYCVGWRVYPPVAGLARRARMLGLETPARWLEDLPLQDHLRETWIWDDPDLRIEPRATVGQYEIFAVLRRAAGE